LRLIRIKVLMKRKLLLNPDQDLKPCLEPRFNQQEIGHKYTRLVSISYTLCFVLICKLLCLTNTRSLTRWPLCCKYVLVERRVIEKKWMEVGQKCCLVPRTCQWVARTVIIMYWWEILWIEMNGGVGCQGPANRLNR